jgi:hypothetical protein
MLMLAAVFLTTCQTVFSEILCPHAFPARQTHGTGTVRMCLPLPIRSTIAQRSSQRCKLSSVSSASSRRRRPQPGRMARIARLRFPVKSLSIGYLPERRLTGCKPVAQTRPQLANTFNAMDTGGQFRAQKSGVSRNRANVGALFWTTMPGMQELRLRRRESPNPKMSPDDSTSSQVYA